MLRLLIAGRGEQNAQMLMYEQLLAFPWLVAGVFWSAGPVSGAPRDARDVAL